MKEKTLHISNISCERCITIIKRELDNLKGVRSVWGDDKEKVLTVWWERPATWNKIADRLNAAGYPTG